MSTLDNVASYLSLKFCTIITISIASISLAVWTVTKPRKVKNAAKVTSLFIHPIKSMRGIEVGTIEVTRSGMKYGIFRDRGMVLISAENRMFSLRQDPRLSLIHVEMTGSTEITLSCEGYETLKITPRTIKNLNEDTIKFNIWSLATEGVEVSPEASQWFCNFLGVIGIRLVQHLPNMKMRPIKTAQKNGQQVDTSTLIRYQDDDPVHLTSNDTLSQLNSTLDEDVMLSHKNFRPNIVVEGAPPHDEEHWSEVVINNVRMQSVKLCDRCAVPTVDIEKGKKIEAKVKILKDFRSAKNEMERNNYGSNGIFGVMFVPLNEGFVSIGSNVDVCYK